MASITAFLTSRNKTNPEEHLNSLLQRGDSIADAQFSIIELSNVIDAEANIKELEKAIVIYNSVIKDAPPQYPQKQLVVNKIADIQMIMDELKEYDRARDLAEKAQLAEMEEEFLEYSLESLHRYKIINGNLTNDRYDNSTYKSHLNYTGTFDLYSDKADLTRTSSYGNGEYVTSQDKMDASPLNKFNFGLRMGVGYEYMGINLSLHYQWMVTNMANKNYWDGNRWTILQSNDEYHMTGYSQHNNFIMITVGYTFRY